MFRSNPQVDDPASIVGEGLEEADQETGGAGVPFSAGGRERRRGVCGQVDVTRVLSSAERYRGQFERLHRKYDGCKRMHRLVHAGVSFAELLFDPQRLSNEMARAVAAGRYVLSPARVKEVMLDKPRELFVFEALDFVLHGVLADMITTAMEPMLSDALYSYRPGWSSLRAVHDFAAYVREHRALYPKVNERGLYVFRGDVRSYADSIPIGAASAVWSMLRNILGTQMLTAHWSLIEGAIRPEIADRDGRLSMRCRGLPLGSPVTTAILNLYLHDLDDALCAVPEAFYARFGDDLLFAHPDPCVVGRAVSTISEQIRSKWLELHADKQRVLFFNGAARPSRVWPQAVGASAVVFLGCEMRFDGTITLPRQKWRLVLTDVAARIRRTNRLFRREPLDMRGTALCSVVNESLDPSSPLANRHAPRLRYHVTNRGQLAELDHHIARMISEALTAKRGPRAFRYISPRRLREAWGLVSLVELRNRR